MTRTRQGAASDFTLQLSGEAWQNGLVGDVSWVSNAGWLWGTRAGLKQEHLINFRQTSTQTQKNTPNPPVFELPWTLSRMCCWTSPAALVARQVYFPESSSLASVTWSVLPEESNCGEYKEKQRDLYY